jgi:protein ATS1
MIAGIDFAATRAECGRDFTLIVGEPSTGHVVVLGAGGNDRFGIRTNAPANLSGWTDVTASWCSIYALKASGDVVAWGRNDHGQLPPHGLPDMSALTAGSEHCIALTTTGKVLAWGWGEHGNCGSPTDENGDVKGRWNEIEVSGRVSRIFAGCATSFILTDEQASEG